MPESTYRSTMISERDHPDQNTLQQSLSILNNYTKMPKGNKILFDEAADDKENRIQET